MFKFLWTLLALSLATTVLAADLYSWPAQKPQQLTQRLEPIQVTNLWATWCVPCLKEMPTLSKWYQAQQAKPHRLRVGLIGIAIDEPTNIERFLQRTPVRYPIWRYAGNDSRAWMQNLGNTVGVLPFTLVEAKACQYRQTLLGELTAAKLEQAVAGARKACSGKS